MYLLTEHNKKKIKGFINSIPESLAKGNYQRWYDRVKADNKITSTEMDEFVSMSNSLLSAYQSFPQEFLAEIKNAIEDSVDTIQKEVKKAEEIKQKAVSKTASVKKK